MKHIGFVAGAAASVATMTGSFLLVSSPEAPAANSLEKCATEQLPPLVQASVFETVGYWREHDIDLTDVEVTYVPDPTDNGCLLLGVGNIIFGPIYDPSTERVVLTGEVNGLDLTSPVEVQIEVGHEFGHVVMGKEGLSMPGVFGELGADCLLGKETEATHPELVDKVAQEIKQMGDHEQSTDPHGDGRDRQAAVRQGAETGKCELVDIAGLLPTPASPSTTATTGETAPAAA